MGTDVQSYVFFLHNDVLQCYQVKIVTKGKLSESKTSKIPFRKELIQIEMQGGRAEWPIYYKH